MTNGFSVQPGDLAAHEQTLRSAAEAVERLQVPGGPSAGQSTFEIAEVISQLTTAVADAGEQLTALAVAFADAARAYDDVDDAIAVSFGGW